MMIIEPFCVEKDNPKSKYISIPQVQKAIHKPKMRKVHGRLLGCLITSRTKTIHSGIMCTKLVSCGVGSNAANKVLMKHELPTNTSQLHT